jgi:hypothetical protein
MLAKLHNPAALRQHPTMRRPTANTLARTRTVLGILAAALIANGCGGGTGGSSTDPAELQANLVGDYTGVFPCDNCPGIRTSLRLVADGHYFLEQVYLGDEQVDESIAASVGRWRVAPYDTIVLRGDGPERTFESNGSDSLRMQTNSSLDYVLERSPARLALNTTLRLAGDLRVGSGGMSIVDCRSGVSLPVATGGDYPRILRQLRKIGSGVPVFAELDGRIAWNSSGRPTSVHVVRLGTLRTDKTCR